MFKTGLTPPEERDIHRKPFLNVNLGSKAVKLSVPWICFFLKILSETMAFTLTLKMMVDLESQGISIYYIFIYIWKPWVTWYSLGVVSNRVMTGEDLHQMFRLKQLLFWKLTAPSSWVPKNVACSGRSMLLEEGSILRIVCLDLSISSMVAMDLLGGSSQVPWWSNHPH